MIARFLSGLAAAALVALAARRARSLSASGAMAATGLGAVAVAAGWDWGVMLVVFFVTTSALSRFRASEKSSLTGDVMEKGGERDAAQVLANGGVFGAAAAGCVATGESLWIAIGAGALAAAAADSWATETGILSGAPPLHVGSGKRVEPGTSGGITLAGILGAFAGSAMVGLTVVLLGRTYAVAGAAFIAGVAGMFFDSILGATIQAGRRCSRCNRATERVIHGCGNRTDLVRGMPWLNNDGVNLLTTAFGGAVALALYHVFA